MTSQHGFDLYGGYGGFGQRPVLVVPPIVRGLHGNPDAITNARAPKSKATTKTNPYDDPKLASHVRYLSANNFADGFVPFIARVISSCVTRFAPINF